MSGKKILTMFAKHPCCLNAPSSVFVWPCEESTGCSLVCGYISCYVCCSLLPQAKIIYEAHRKKNIIFFVLKLGIGISKTINLN